MTLKLIGLALAAAALIGALVFAIAWHAERKAELFHQGELAERAAWEAKAIAAERARSEERRRAAEELSMQELRHIASEDALRNKARGLADELEQALAAANAAFHSVRIPGGVLEPLRKQGAAD